MQLSNSSQLESSGTAVGEGIDIQGDNVEVLSSHLVARSDGVGRGDISVQAEDLTLDAASTVRAVNGDNNTGQGPGISIFGNETADLEGTVETITETRGEAGSILIRSKEVTIGGSVNSSFSDVSGFDWGPAGTVRIEGESITITGEITTKNGNDPNSEPGG